MLANLFNKGFNTAPIESPSLYSQSPLCLINNDSDISQQPQQQPPKISNFPLYGSTEIYYFKFDISDFRILVLEDTGNVLSNDRYFVLYDSDLEKAYRTENKTEDSNQNKSSRSPTSRSSIYNYGSKKADLEIKELAQYVFGSSLQGEVRQTSRIHCEPMSSKLRSFKKKTLVVRAYHFDAKYENSLIDKGKKVKNNNDNNKHGHHSREPSLNNQKPTFNTNLFDDPHRPLNHKPEGFNSPLADDVTAESWQAKPSSKIDHDFGSRNNTPIGICLILPFDSQELTQTVSSNFTEFEKWLYEIQDLTLKYLKKYYSAQIKSFNTNNLQKNAASTSSSTSLFMNSELWYSASKSKNKTAKVKRYFKVDNKNPNRISFEKLILQSNFQSENVFLNYFHRINYFLNTPRLVPGILTLEKLLKLDFSLIQNNNNHSNNNSNSPKNIKKPIIHSKKMLFGIFCKEIRNWITIHDSSDKSYKFISTLLAILAPIRLQLIESRPSDKKSQIIRLVLYGQSEVVLNSLMIICNCFLPDVIFKFDMISEIEFEKKKNSIDKSNQKVVTPKVSSSSLNNNKKDDETNSIVDSSFDSLDSNNINRTPSKPFVPALDLTIIDNMKFESELMKRSEHESFSISRPHTPVLLKNSPLSPVSGKSLKGLRISSPKAIPIAQSSNYDSISVYSSENSSFKSMTDSSENMPLTNRSDSINSISNFVISAANSRLNSRSSSFVQNDDEINAFARFRDPPNRRRLTKTLSVADLTQKSIRASNLNNNKNRNFLNKKVDLLIRRPTVINAIDINKLSGLTRFENDEFMDFPKLNIPKTRIKKINNHNISNTIVSFENSNYMKKYVKDLLFDTEMRYKVDNNNECVEVEIDLTKESSWDHYKQEFVNNDIDYEFEEEDEDYEDLFKKCLFENYSTKFKRFIVPSSEIYLPPLVGSIKYFIPEFGIQTVKKHENISSSVISAMKQDLFHNEYIDNCYGKFSQAGECYKKSITKTFLVNVTTHEIYEYEIFLKPPEQNNHKSWSFTNGSSGSISDQVEMFTENNNTFHVDAIAMALNQASNGEPLSGSFNSVNNRHSSIYSNSSISSSSEGSSPSKSSPIKSSSNHSILNLFEFSNHHITNLNPFKFDDKDFLLEGNKIMDDHGKLCKKELQDSILNMDKVLNYLASFCDNFD